MRYVPLFAFPRYYDASAGRFTSRDSYDGQTTDPITENHYVYAGADPANSVDPNGHVSLGEEIGNISIGTRIVGFTLRVAPTATKVTNFLFEAITGETVYVGVAGVVVAGRSGRTLQRIVGGVGTWLYAALRLRGRGLKIGPYGFFKGLGAIGEQANHLNQEAAFPGIPSNDGVAIAFQGAVHEAGSLHRLFHQSMEAFFDQFRPGGPLDYRGPTNHEYDAALRKAMDRVGLLPDEIDVLSVLAQKSRRYWGYFDGPGGKQPVVPGRVPTI